MKCPLFVDEDFILPCIIGINEETVGEAKSLKLCPTHDKITIYNPFKMWQSSSI